jgi:anthranilate synthase component I
MESLAATSVFAPSRVAVPAARALVRAGTVVPTRRTSSRSGTSGVKCSAAVTPQASPVISRSAAAAKAAEEDKRRFFEAAARGSGKGNLVPMWECIVSDHLTPVLAYRCLVPEDNVDAPSFLFESVEQGPQGTTNVVRASCSLVKSAALFIEFHPPSRARGRHAGLIGLDRRAATAWWEPTR